MSTELDTRVKAVFGDIVARTPDIGPAPSDDVVHLTPTVNRTRRRWLAVAAALVVVAGAGAFIALQHGPADDPDPADLPPSTVVPTPDARVDPFEGRWSSTDVDGSSQTMEIVRSGAGRYEVSIRDDAATAACAGAASTITGIGLLESAMRLDIAQPELTCEDGSTPAIELIPQADLAHFSIEADSVTGELVDGFGVVWRRVVPTVGLATSGGMWPQSSLDEVSAAQARADAADPAYEWQLFEQSAADAEPWEAGIFTRFIEDGLGWEAYVPRTNGYAGGEGVYAELVAIRCAPGRTNPLAPQYEDMPTEIRECAPTIDDFTYETVMLSLTQPGRRGAPGLWVVEQWEILDTPSEGSLFWLLYPDLGQVRQVVPPSDDEVNAVLVSFLQARVDGRDAEQHLLTDPAASPSTEVPLLYGTTDGVSYQRYTTIEQVQGPVWPTGWREFKVVLVAEDETVVEQYFDIVREDGRLGLIYGYASGAEVQTTENGEPVAVRQSAFGDTVTFTAPPSTPHGDGSEEIELRRAGAEGRMIMTVDFNPEFCPDPPKIGQNTQPVDAEAVARSIAAIPDIDAAAPVPVRIADTDALYVDATSSGPNECLVRSSWMNDLLADHGAWQMRMYLLDYPDSAGPQGSSFRLHVLAITIIASPDDFDTVHELATPILDSLAFESA